MQHLPPMDPWGANGAQPMQPQQQYYAGAGLPQQPHQQAPYPGAGPQQPQQYYGQPQPQQAQQYPASGPNYGGGLAQQQAAPHGYPGANGPAAYLQQQQYGQQQPPYGGYQAQAPLQPMPQPQPQQQLLQPALKPQQRPPMGAGQQVAIIDGRYCSPQPLQLIMKEAITMGSYGSDNFHIMDAHGRTHFM
ncbi:hypothetical protein MNEG_4301 [Monoraphidium neglectum]|uniref:Uncharacterized protein n=1 Tax=Monoraphidium neglectum TaxID=145388 RepID=A0A0D2JYS5_9CHLO|nr:hypothetical protein MNEG_4301 [Monoraphidium neglectum]KIZ03658.1 hypothetical protein MNEG_4301 [Monoraphidium neglectum]|eukprot:XP_013902677.1 hypothetical protein MNEG_4301 [Monoraphidium neglectum]